MSEGFLKRWSRRKREGTQDAAAPEEEAASPQPEQARAEAARPPDAGEAATQATSGGTDEETIDPATLPPIESLGPDSDYTVFLKKGVPESLRIAALRKAWVSDPFIRDFRGPAEYAIDYTTAEFDLRPTDDVAKMLDRLFPPKAKDDPQGSAPEASGVPAPPAEWHDPAVQNVSQSPQDASGPALSEPTVERESAPASPPRRKHGGALPDDID